MMNVTYSSIYIPHSSVTLAVLSDGDRVVSLAAHGPEAVLSGYGDGDADGGS